MQAQRNLTVKLPHVESTRTGCITVWVGRLNAHERRSLQNMVDIAQSIMGLTSPPLMESTRSVASRRQLILSKAHMTVATISIPLSGRRQRRPYCFFPSTIGFLNNPGQPNHQTSTDFAPYFCWHLYYYGHSTYFSAILQSQGLV